MILISDFFSLFFPNLCAACGNSLWKNESVLCTNCDYHLPRTNFYLDPDNPVKEVFAGRIDPEFVTALLYFNKGSHVQQLIHLLKYKNRRDVGFWFGNQLGLELTRASGLPKTDLIIPVPLHEKKLLKRGYNQSEEFAKGIADILDVPVNTTALIRQKATETQTRKSRFNRWENVSDIFKLVHPDQVAGKNVLLVDDVITTGATIDSCFTELASAKGTSISIGAIATALR